MNEKKLVTLKEIADELGVNYRTVIDYKNHFRNHIQFQFQGCYRKYPQAYIDFFRLILAFREEGYSIRLMKMFLSREVGLPEKAHLQEWLLRWRDASIHTEMDGYIPPNLDGGVHPQMDGGVPPDLDGCIHPQMDGGDHPHPDGKTHLRPDQDQNAEKTVADTSEELENMHNQTDWSQLKQELQAEFSALVDQKVNELLPQKLARLVNTVDARLLNATGEINGALTRFYQQIALLQEGVKAVEERLKTLEGDLGVVSDQESNFPEIDLEEIQVNLPEPLSLVEDESEKSQSEEQEEIFLHADMDFLKNSISDGRPDREAVIQWISAERTRHPEASYADLAEQLNQAEVPTLRGRYGWNRGVIRNLAVNNEL